MKVVLLILFCVLLIEVTIASYDSNEGSNYLTDEAQISREEESKKNCSPDGGSCVSDCGCCEDRSFCQCHFAGEEKKECECMRGPTIFKYQKKVVCWVQDLVNK
uniref:U17-Hypotoxin-Hsp1a_1 n=1 Tax=Hypochilus sp. SGP-2016 TaxID=1905178 RepID=A0A482Z931_9ARAC